jgi:hypothetical protein
MEEQKYIKKWTLPGFKQFYPIEIPPKKREWMEVNNKHAYKCLPLVVANGFGWEIKNPIKFDALWNGSIRHENAIKFNFYPENEDEKKIIDSGFISSHFGNGIITFSSLNFILRTTPGHNIFVKAPTNYFKHGAHALEAIVETDWLPYTFTCNWKITNKDTLVTFEKGEAIACIFPFQRNYIESFEVIEEEGDANSEFGKQHSLWGQKRAGLKEAGESKKEHQWYVKGIENVETNKKFEEHQRSISGCPFKNLFKKNEQ